MYGCAVCVGFDFYNFLGCAVYNRKFSHGSSEKPHLRLLCCQSLSHFLYVFSFGGYLISSGAEAAGSLRHRVSGEITLSRGLLSTALVMVGALG